MSQDIYEEVATRLTPRQIRTLEVALRLVGKRPLSGAQISAIVAALLIIVGSTPFVLARFELYIEAIKQPEIFLMAALAVSGGTFLITVGRQRELIVRLHRLAGETIRENLRLSREWGGEEHGSEGRAKGPP